MQRLLTFIMLLTILSPMSVAQKKHKSDKSNSAPKTDDVVVVDDESCGCELVFIDGIQTTERDGKFVFKLADGTEIVKPQYMFVDKFKNGYCIVLRDYDRYGLINKEGKEVVPCEYQNVTLPADGMIRVQKDGLYGFVHEDGTPAIEPQYRAASTFNEGLAVVAVDIDSFTVSYGYIDKENRIVIQPKYQYANPFYNGYAVVKQYERNGMIDRNGKMVFPAKYEFLSAMDNNGIFLVMDPEGDHIAMFNRKFKQITPYQYDDFISYSDGFYVFVKHGQKGLIDAKGKEHFGLYDNVGGFQNGFCMVRKNDKYGIIDKKGKFILPLEYSNKSTLGDAYTFHEGLALVMKNDSCGFINTKGEIVIPLQYQSGFYFEDGLCPVQKNGVWGYIDHSGNVKIPFIFLAASPFEYHRAEVYYNNNVHKINPDGKCIKSCKDFPKW